jgi:hypothetical protein
MLLSVLFGSERLRSRCQAVSKKVMEPANIVKSNVEEVFNPFMHSPYYEVNSEIRIEDTGATGESGYPEPWAPELKGQQQKVQAWQAELEARKEERQEAPRENWRAKAKERLEARRAKVEEWQEARRAKGANGAQDAD